MLNTVFPHIVSRKLFFFEFGHPKITVHKGAETIQGRKLFKEGNYSREETIQGHKLYVILF